MVIRSQDKRILLTEVKYLFIEQSRTDRKYKIKTDSGLYIGAYSTEGKAHMILDFFAEAIEAHDYCKLLGKEDTAYSSCVFQMPADAEI